MPRIVNRVAGLLGRNRTAPSLPPSFLGDNGRHTPAEEPCPDHPAVPVTDPGAATKPSDGNPHQAVGGGAHPEGPCGQRSPHAGAPGCAPTPEVMGMAGMARRGVARHGMARLGLAWLGRQGSAWQGPVRQGWAGGEWQGKARLGSAGQAWRGLTRRGRARLGAAWQAWHGKAAGAESRRPLINHSIHQGV